MCKQSMVSIKHGKKSAQVDKGIAKLIHAAWLHDIETEASSAGCKECGIAWIEFLSHHDATLFMGKIISSSAMKDYQDLYERMFPDEPDVVDAWDCQVLPVDTGVFIEGDTIVDLITRIRFPASDIEAVTDCLLADVDDECHCEAA